MVIEFYVRRIICNISNYSNSKTNEIFCIDENL
jgi:hypothetical protein